MSTVEGARSSHKAGAKDTDETGFDNHEQETRCEGGPCVVEGHTSKSSEGRSEIILESKGCWVT